MSLGAMFVLAAVAHADTPGATAARQQAGGAPRAAGTLQEPPHPQAVSPAELHAAIDKLGDLDYTARTSAARTVRRTPGDQAVPALIQAVSEHRDGYVRYRALVLLTGFNNPRAKDSMHEALTSPNDRLRAVAFSFFEHNPDPSMIPLLLAALETEQGEFVRPALVRALAVHGSDTRVRPALVREVGRGQDFFRSAVIEALGDYRAGYAFDALTAIAKLDGPLAEDAAVALGKIGDKRALETLATLQRTAPRAMQPALACAICLLGVNCDVHEHYLVETLRFADKNLGYQDLLRGAASGLGRLAVSGRAEAVDALLEVGIPSRDPTRAPIALALGTVALRDTALMMAILEKRTDRDGLIELMGEGFDMLEEDLDKERFFAAARRAYWEAPEASPTRKLVETLIQKLDF